MLVRGRRRFVAVLLVAGVAALAVAIGASARSRDTVTLTLEALQTNQGSYPTIIANFEAAYPNIKIDPTYSPNVNYLSSITTQLRAGAGPDIFYAVPGTGIQLGTIPAAQAGWLADMSKRPWVKNIPKAMKGLVTVNGKVYGSVTEVVPFVTFYNTDIFKQAGAVVPTTWAQLLADCTKIAAIGKIPISEGGTDIGDPYVLLSQLQANDVYSHQPYWNALKQTGKSTFAGTSGYAQSLTQMQQMKDAGCFSSGILGTSKNSSIATFGSGQAGMYASTGAVLSLINQVNPTFPIKAFSIPAVDPKNTRAIFGPSAGLGVYSGTKHLKEATEFLDYMERPDVNRLLTKLSGNISPLDFQKGILPSYMAAAYGPLVKSKHYIPIPIETAPSVMQVTMVNGWQALLGGSKSIPDILGSWDTAWDKTK
jgi:raffinose/stachyose/melibiose transport system substrate-binding protein